MFEGYVGIHLWSEQKTDDLLFSILLGMLLLFAIMFRCHAQQFMKMLKDSWSMKRRQSLFEVPVKENSFFHFFMLVQPILLSGLILFVVLYKLGYIVAETTVSILQNIGFYTAILCVFFLVKQCFYFVLGMVFGGADKYRWWKNGYDAIMGIWGATLYIPAIWLILVGIDGMIPVILFVTLYILCRFAIIYKIMRIFYTKNKGLFYISLYLCAQEILPLFFLYKGVVYLYNVIG